MSRPRIFEPGLVVHVITRGNNRRRLFSRWRDYQLFLACLARSKRKNPCSIHALSLMPNHVHLALSPPDKEGLARFVKGFSQRYAQLRNRILGGTGKLFEQRYLSVIVENDAALARVTAYVDLNAYRSGLVDDPLDHAWSTYGLHVNQKERCRIPSWLWTPSEWYLNLGPTSRQRAAAYSEFAIEWARAARHAKLSERAARVEARIDDSRRILRPDGSSAR